MRLIALECPKCNAQLEINSELTRATCNYCGCNFLIEDEVKRAGINSENAYNVGYDFERGRYERQLEECQNLANKVKELIEPLLDLHTKRSELKVISAQMNSLEMKEKLMSSFGETIKSYGVPGYIILMTLALTLIGGGIGLFIIGFIVAAISAYVIKCKRNKEKSNVSQQLKQKREELIDTESDIFLISNQYDFNLIPEQYRYEEAMRYIHEVLYNQRAMNISQAINLYEDYQHKMRLESLQREQIAMQKKQIQISEKNMTNQAANGSGLGSLLKVGGVLLAIASFANLMDDE